MFLPDLLHHLETLSRNVLRLSRKEGNRVEIDALCMAEAFFHAHAESFKELEAVSPYGIRSAPPSV